MIVLDAFFLLLGNNHDDGIAMKQSSDEIAALVKYCRCQCEDVLWHI